MTTNVIMMDPDPINPYGTDLCNGLAACGCRPLHVTAHGYRHHDRSRTPVRELAAMSSGGDRVLKALQHLEYLGFLARLGPRRAKLVHVQWFRFPHEWRFFEWAHRRGCKLVLTAHNVLPHEDPERQRRFHERWYAVPDAIIVHTEEARRRLANEFGIDGAKMWVIRPGPTEPIKRDLIERATARKRLALPPEETVFLMFGQLRDYKGWEDSLDAFEDAVAGGVRCRLVIAGRATPGVASRIEARLARAHPEAAARITRRIEVGRFLEAEAIEEVFAAADAVLLPYRAITFSGVMLHALALGRPVIAADLPGLVESFDPGISGILYRAGSRSGLHEAMAGAARRGPNAGFSASAIQAALEARHSWERAGSKTLDVYRSLGLEIA